MDYEQLIIAMDMKALLPGTEIKYVLTEVIVFRKLNDLSRYLSVCGFTRNLVGGGNSISATLAATTKITA